MTRPVKNKCTERFGCIAIWLIAQRLEQVEQRQTNEEGPAFYDRVFDACAKHGIKPLVTISHYETPLNLAEKYNGRVSREMIGFYQRSIRGLFDRYGSKVKYWLTFNEINSVLHEPFLSGAINTPKDQLIHERLRDRSPCVEDQGRGQQQ